MVSILFAIAIWLGVVGVVWGLYGKSAQRGAWCRLCRYPLAVDAVGRCPECGADLGLRRAVRRGRRVPRRTAIVAGVLILVVAGVGRYGHHLWTDVRARPGWMLAMEIKLRDPKPRGDLWPEVIRRVQDGEITDRQIELLMPVALSHLDMPTWPAGYGHPFMETLLVAERLPPEHLPAYAASVAGRVGAAKISRVVPGKTAVYTIDPLRLSWRQTMGDTVVMEVRGMDVDGVEVELLPKAPRRGDACTGLVWIPEDFPGSGTLTAQVELIGVRSGRFTRHSIRRFDQRIAMSWRIPIIADDDAPFHEVDDPTWKVSFPDLIIVSADIRPDEHGTPRPRPVRVGGAQGMPDLAFDVYWRADDFEWKVESFSFRTPREDLRSYGRADMSRFPSAVESVDIVMRSNLDTANLHPGLRQVWVGEYVLEDVPVRWLPALR